MENNPSNTRWVVNVTSFILFAVLALTGLINWWLLPRGGGSSGGFLITLRHFLRDIHEWTALLFILCLVIHLALHIPYIKTNLKKYGWMK